jgi:hypothetical protein
MASGAKDLRWWPAITLGAVALIRPILSVVGVYKHPGLLHEPAGPLILTALLSLLWIVVAVALRLESPTLTLTVAGLVYALLALLMNLALQPFLDTAELIPVAGIISMIITNALQGAVLGLIASLILRLTVRRRNRP